MNKNYFKKEVISQDYIDPFEKKELVMQRSVPQLLYYYLPSRTVEWEEGLAIVKLGRPRFKTIWDENRSRLVIEKVQEFMENWRSANGKIDPDFPDLTKDSNLVTVGEPRSIEAQVLDTAFVCRNCSRLLFIKQSSLSRQKPICPECKKPTLRQLGLVFIHGCGELVPLNEWVPYNKRDDNGRFQSTIYPIRCRHCGEKGKLYMPSRAERIRDMQVFCTECKESLSRIVARCPICSKKIAREESNNEESMEGKNLTIVQRTAMRETLYSANQAYYPQNISILRLDRPAIIELDSKEVKVLRNMLPKNSRPEVNVNKIAIYEALLKKAKDNNEDIDEVIRNHFLKSDIPESAEEVDVVSYQLQEDVIKGLHESIAFLTTVNRRPIRNIIKDNGLSDFTSETLLIELKNLGFRSFDLVDDLPIVSTTFGYTRRTYEATYSESDIGAEHLSTTIRAFPYIDDLGASTAGRPEISGNIPFLALEGEHEGIFFSLDPQRVLHWLRRNGINITNSNNDALEKMLSNLESIDRFYNEIWEKPVRRMVFGLIHSISHIFMRVISHYAGLERTSLKEYIFLPLLGAVIYDGSSTFKLGCIETSIRKDLEALLNELSDMAMTCMYDTECIDHKGACHGCIHSPEICCPVFNHGLSRSFLQGGHAPWGNNEEHLIGYWEVEKLK
jgi:hypothetical protein